MPAVGTVRGGNAAEIADRSLGNAHVVVQEVLDLDACRFSKLTCLGDGDVTGCDDARDPGRFKVGGTVLVVNVHHGAGVHRRLNSKLTNQVQQPDVLNDDGIRSDLLQKSEMILEDSELTIGQHVVDGHVDLYAVPVAVVDGLGKFVVLEVQRFGMLSHGE